MAESTTNSAAPQTSTREDFLRRAEIDKSVRLPFYFLITSAASWLFVATILGLIASIKLFAPSFLDWNGLHWMQYGRLQPAFVSALVYGWALQAGLGVMLWLMARLTRVPLRKPGVLLVAGHFWNAGVLIGVVAIFMGRGTSLEWFDFPSFVWPLLFVAYLLVTVWMVIMFKARRDGEVFVSQWYLLGACFWLPWALITTYVLVHQFGASGVAATGVAAWFQSVVFLLFFVPVGLASAYYIIPKISGRPIHSYHLAILGFWGLAILGGWAGFQKYNGGPFPAWMPGLSAGALIFMVLPVLAVALNHHLSVKGHHALVQYSPSLRFTFFGALSYTIYSILAAIFGTLGASPLTQFTLVGQGMTLYAVYAFFSMCMFGAIYFIMPRLAGCEWVSRRLIRFHFWTSAYGSLAMIGCLLIGGFFQGASAEKPEVGWYAVVESAKPLLVGQAFAWAFILVSNLGFLFHLALMVFRLGRRSPKPTLIHEMPEEGSGAAAHA
ncbi:MAG: cbb3-type cytochrome c oxidase subunit I [Verrucomicrobiales bacterium]